MKLENNYIHFITLKIEGFGSIAEPYAFKLDEKGLNIIRGPNGVGKTTIFSALAWVLYGVLLKKGGTIETWEHLRPKVWNGTMVSVTFIKDNIRYKVIRCKDYKKKIGELKGGNRLILEEGGVPLRLLKDKRDIQKYIEGILGMSYNLFSNVILFPQKALRFIEETGPNKKAILEESFKINWISKAQDIAKTIKRETVISLDKVEALYNQTHNSIISIEDMIKELEKDKRDFYENKQKKIEDLESKIKEHESKINSSLIDIEPLMVARDSAMDGAREISQMEKELYINKGNLDKILLEINNVKEEIRNLDSKKENVSPEKHKCPECGTELDSHKYNELLSKWDSEILNQKETLVSLKSQKLEIEENIALLQKKLEETQRDGDSFEDLDKQYQKALGHNKSLEDSIALVNTYKGQLQEIQKSYYRDNSPTILKSLKEFQNKLKELKPQRSKLRYKVKLLDWAINDPLGNSGIKSFLFDRLLDRLNYRLKFYEKYIGMRITLEIDLNTGRKDINAIINKNGAPVDYRDLSGGESRMIDLAISLGTGDVLLSSNPMNIRVYDEPLESLDPDNVEIVTNLLRAIGENYSVFFITHNPAFQVAGANIIHLKKDIYG